MKANYHLSHPFRYTPCVFRLLQGLKYRSISIFMPDTDIANATWYDRDDNDLSQNGW